MSADKLWQLSSPSSHRGVQRCWNAEIITLWTPDEVWESVGMWASGTGDNIISVCECVCAHTREKEGGGGEGIQTDKFCLIRIDDIQFPWWWLTCNRWGLAVWCFGAVVLGWNYDLFTGQRLSRIPTRTTLGGPRSGSKYWMLNTVEFFYRIWSQVCCGGESPLLPLVVIICKAAVETKQEADGKYLSVMTSWFFSCWWMKYEDGFVVYSWVLKW